MRRLFVLASVLDCDDTTRNPTAKLVWELCTVEIPHPNLFTFIQSTRIRQVLGLDVDVLEEAQTQPYAVFVLGNYSSVHNLAYKRAKK